MTNKVKDNNINNSNNEDFISKLANMSHKELSDFIKDHGKRKVVYALIH